MYVIGLFVFKFYLKIDALAKMHVISMYESPNYCFKFSLLAIIKSTLDFLLLAHF